ncbi:hypothetical protein F2P81_006436 [Scophthalmus maximus]|uniref:Uncharacterized protein n=1 Tax=Scophthalmus maximus TaxID=52904 RepID=A0A6A4T861_SCOMX|nr:hypothetical protein F2P81_006436 [Scophthalmus maximus]
MARQSAAVKMSERVASPSHNHQTIQSLEVERPQEQTETVRRRGVGPLTEKSRDKSLILLTRNYGKALTVKVECGLLTAVQNFTVFPNLQMSVSLRHIEKRSAFVDVGIRSRKTFRKTHSPHTVCDAEVTHLTCVQTHMVVRLEKSIAPFRL